nr:hypothetical protein CFP56_34647 [Quercus suber]
MFNRRRYYHESSSVEQSNTTNKHRVKESTKQFHHKCDRIAQVSYYVPGFTDATGAANQNINLCPAVTFAMPAPLDEYTE